VSDPVLLSYSLDGSGGGVALHDGAVSCLLKDDQLAWAHLNADLLIQRLGFGAKLAI
jgi:hypothetical protein